MLKIVGIVIVSILIILFAAPYIFPDTVGKQIKKWTNQSITGELNFTTARLSFFTHFPALTLSLSDVSLMGSAPFRKDTLLSAEKLGFGINLKKLIFDHTVSINKIYLNQANINVLVNEKGLANYNIYQSDTNTKSNTEDTVAASLHLEKIIIKDSHLNYSDQSVPMLIQAEHLYYEGTGDLSASIFDLKSNIKTDSLNFTINNLSYVRRKAFDAQLITHINTKTLAFVFENNELQVNKLKLSLKGKLDFLQNGYDMNFSITSKDADLYQLITILPPEYLDWLRQTTVKGNVTLNTTLKGRYVASTNEMPDYHLNLAFHDGYIAYQDAKLPVSLLHGRAVFDMPSLDPEKMHLKVDSFGFNLDQDYVHGQLETRGLTEPEVDTRIEGKMNLANLKKALGISSYDMQGQMDLNLTARGKYSKKLVRTSLRKKELVIATIPAFDISCTLKNGFIKYYKVPQPVKNIFLLMHASCPDADYHHAFFKIDSLHAAALNNYIEGSAIVHASTDFPMNMTLKGLLNLADIKQVYPLDSLTLSGLVKFDVNSAGKYAPDHHLFPKTDGHFQMENGFIQTKYYPHPVEKINLDVHASDPRGDLRSLAVLVKPASLQFEEKPFYFTGSFRDFEDLHYDLAMNGELDLGRIYQVFAQKDLGVSGFVRVHAKFKGKQSDAKNGRYDRLQNSGIMQVKNLQITNELFPKPFLINDGDFTFQQDKMWFKSFHARYGASDLQLNGFAENAINYVLGKNEILHANFDLKSRMLNLNEFSAYASSAQTVKDTVTTTGVILIPSTLDLTLRANADKILYQDVQLNQFTGGVIIHDTSIELTETAFELIGCTVNMKGKYKSITPLRAGFEYSLQAKDFDVQRAYKEIKLFHDLASSAEHASGIISIDYALTGKLNEKMRPVYPSLSGGGVLSVKKVKYNGWKLFNTMSSSAGKSDLKDPDLSKIDVKSTIKNNLITIEKMKFKTGVLRIRFEGQTSFDNRVNFKVRVGLPPLGIIGIPLRITGSSDNPKIKLGKSDTDPLEEKTDE